MDIDIKKIAIYEPRLKLDNEREWVIVKGGQSVTTNKYPSQNFSNSSMNFSTNPPGKKNVLDRHVIVEVPVELTFTALTVGGQNVVQGGRDAFRSFPIASITETLTCTINGFPVTIESAKIAHVLENFHNGVDVGNTYQSLYPNMRDTFQNYEDGFGSDKNPLSMYKDYTANIPRGAYEINTLAHSIDGLNSKSVLNATLREQIILPPFLFDDSQAGGFTNLDTLEFNFNLSPSLERIWSRQLDGHPAGQLLSLGVKISQPIIFLNWITPRDTQIIPDSIKYPYFQVSRYDTAVVEALPEVAPLATKPIVSQLLQFNSIPRKIYIYVKKNDSDVNASVSSKVSSTDTFFGINSINISWDNNARILSSATPVNLYEMSVNNGLNYDWPSWSGLTSIIPAGNGAMTKQGLKGSIVCLCPGVDFGLRNAQAEGVLDKINFQVTVEAKNINVTKPLAPMLCVMCVYDGFLQIFDNSCRAIIGAICNADVISTPISNNISYHEIQKIYGGSFFSKVRDTGSKLIKKAANANKYLRDTQVLSSALGVIPSTYTQSASKLLKSVGYGKGGVMTGGCGDCGGGALVSRQKMLKNLRKY